MKRYEAFFPGASDRNRFGARIPDYIALNSARIPLSREERGSILIAKAPPKAAPRAKAPPKAAERKSARLAAPSATKMIEALIAA